MTQLTGKRQNGHPNGKDYPDDNADRLEEIVEVLPAHVGAEVVNETDDLAESKDSEAL